MNINMLQKEYLIRQAWADYKTSDEYFTAKLLFGGDSTTFEDSLWVGFLSGWSSLYKKQFQSGEQDAPDKENVKNTTGSDNKLPLKGGLVSKEELILMDCVRIKDHTQWTPRIQGGIYNGDFEYGQLIVSGKVIG